MPLSTHIHPVKILFPVQIGLYSLHGLNSDEGVVIQNDLEV
jgi:hypothetical protein